MKAFNMPVIPGSSDPASVSLITTFTEPLRFDFPSGVCTYSSWTVANSTGQTAAAGVAATAVIQDLTFTDAVRETTCPVTIAYTTGGTTGAEAVTVVGSAISIQIHTGVSTATQIKAAFDASAAAIALASCAISGTGSNAQTAPVTATALTGGTDSAVSAAADTITLAAHGWVTGRKLQATSSGTLPAGLSTSTDYFVIKTDANTIQLATSLANAQAGTAINITGQGTSGATHTFTPVALAGGQLKYQGSLDGTNWFDIGNAVTISSTSTDQQNIADIFYQYVRARFTLTAGQLDSVTTRMCGRGESF